MDCKDLYRTFIGWLLGALSFFITPVCSAEPVALSELVDRDLFSQIAPQPLQYDSDADLDNPISFRPAGGAFPSYLGGAYQIQFTAINDLDTASLVAEPGGSIVDRMLLQVAGGPEHKVLRQGELYPNAYPFSYGFYLNWPPGEKRTLTLIVQSDYFYAPMRFWLKERSSFEFLSRLELAVQWLCLGAGIALGFYNLIIFVASRRRMHLHYALFALCWVFGWAQMLQVPKDLLGWQSPTLHWLGFLLLPITSALFYSHFLDLPRHLPRLYKLSIYNGLASVAVIPVSMLVPGTGVIFASVFTALMMALGFTAGVLRLRSGFKPARYFLLAYTMLLIPNLASNLVNLGLMPPPVFNLYLLGLMGTALDALLLAFAMAYTLQLVNQDNIRLKNNLREQVAARTSALQKTQRKLQQRNAELQSMAYTDPLTKLMNRRSFEEALQQEAERSERLNSFFSLLMIDLDYFKAINDQFGHTVGDECLRQVANLLKNNVRGIDKVSRLGGEEFCVLMPEASESEAVNLAERIGGKLAESRLPACEQVRLTCSIGVAFSSSFPAGSDLIKAADGALYQAKDRGRNTVVVAQAH